jgi:hypothetical protein
MWRFAIAYPPQLSRLTVTTVISWTILSKRLSPARSSNSGVIDQVHALWTEILGNHRESPMQEDFRYKLWDLNPWLMMQLVQDLSMRKKRSLILNLLPDNLLEQPARH